MGFPLFSWQSANKRGSDALREGYERQCADCDSFCRTDVNSEIISTATGLSMEEIKELFD